LARHTPVATQLVALRSDVEQARLLPDLGVVERGVDRALQLVEDRAHRGDLLLAAPGEQLAHAADALLGAGRERASEQPAELRPPLGNPVTSPPSLYAH
jgi:hypothetical protein